MANKLNSENIYQINWTDTVTNWNFRLEFIASDSGDIGSNVIELNPLILRDYEYSYKYDFVKIGLPDEIPRINFEFDLELLAQTNLYELFKNPNYRNSLIYATQNYWIDSTNIVKFYIDYGDLGGYVLMFTGGQLDGGALDIDDSDGILNIEFTDLSRCILQNTSTEILKAASLATAGVSGATVRSIWQLIGYSTASKCYGVCILPSGNPDVTHNRFVFITLSEFILILNKIFQDVGRFYLRNSTASITFMDNFPRQKYYRQSYSQVLSRGTELADSDLSILAYIYDNDSAPTNFFGGLFYEELGNEYKNLYDWLYDVTKSSGYTHWLYPVGSGSTILTENYLIPTRTLDGKSSTEIFNYELLTNMNIKILGNGLPIIQSDYIEVIDKDIASNKIERSKKSENQLNIPIVFHSNMIADGESSDKFFQHYFHVGTIDEYTTERIGITILNMEVNENFIAGLQLHFYNFYYIETPAYSGTDLTSGDVALLPSAMTDIDIADGENSTEFYDPVGFGYDELINATTDYNGYLTAMRQQVDYGVGNTINNVISYVYDNANTTHIETETPCYNGVSRDAGDFTMDFSDNIYFCPNRYMIPIDMEILRNGLYDSSPSNYQILSCNINKNSFAKIELKSIKDI